MGTIKLIANSSVAGREGAKYSNYISRHLTYIAIETPSAARRVADVIDKTTLALGDMPVGRPGRVTGSYEKSVTGLPYVLVYAITQTGGEEAVAIVRVIHTAWDWSAEKWPD